jgi:hypothetical protein
MVGYEACSTRILVVFFLLATVFVLPAGQTSAQNGSRRIFEAGKIAWNIGNFDRPIEDGKPPETQVLDVPDVGTVRCTREDWTIERMRDATQVTTFAPEDIAYPGALLQGGRLKQNDFAPVAIPRTGATLTISGIEVPEPNVTVPVLDFASFQAARRNLLQNIEGTAAAFNYFVEQAYDQSSTSVYLGISGNYGPFSGSGSFNFSGKEHANYVLLSFFQKFYTISFPEPDAPASVFRDGEDFVDPKNQIGPGNPPLYVKSVTYGRQILFLAESSYSAADVRASLQGAYEGEAASVKVNSGLTHQQIMSKTRLSFYMRGGAAAAAVQPIQAKSPDDMYDRVRTLIADQQSAEYSRQNPGLPIELTLRYLADDTPAVIGLRANYQKNNCEILGDFSMQFTNVDDDVYVFVNGGQQYRWDALAKKAPNPPQPLKLNDYLAEGDNTVIVKLGNYGCFVSSLNLDLFNGTRKVDTRGYTSGGWSHCGWQAEWHYRLNRQTGQWSFLSEPSWPD